MEYSNKVLQNKNEHTNVKIAGICVVAAPTHSELKRFAEIHKKSLTEKQRIY